MAFNTLAKDLNTKCTCVGFAELDSYAKQVYRSIFKPSEDEVEIGSISTFRTLASEGKTMLARPDRKQTSITPGSFDFLVADIPCERYSDESGGNTQFEEILWMAKTYLPEFVLIEAPWNATTYDKSNSMRHVISELEGIGFYCSFCMLNAKDFGCPQNRSKIYIFGSRCHYPFSFEFSFKNICTEFEYLNNKSIPMYNSVLDILDKEDSSWITQGNKDFVFADTYCNKKLFHTINADPSLSIKPNMFKMQRANADNYYTESFICSGGLSNEAKTMNQSEWKSIEHVRRLNMKECLLLQGFSPEAYDTVARMSVPSTAILKMIGQSTNVNIAYVALLYIIKKFNLK